MGERSSVYPFPEPDRPYLSVGTIQDPFQLMEEYTKGAISSKWSTELRYTAVPENNNNKKVKKKQSK